MATCSPSTSVVLSELDRLGRVDWNVRVGERYGHGVGVATYLARCVRGGPLRNTQRVEATPEAVVAQAPMTWQAFLMRCGVKVETVVCSRPAPGRALPAPAA